MQAVVLFSLVAVLPLAEPCRSGPQPGQKFGPYSFLIATGPKRGTSHCYVCETGAKPAMIVFARNTSATLGELLKEADGLCADAKQPLAAWVTFLAEDQPAMEPKLAAWNKKLGLKAVPLGVFEDVDGPPSYRLNPQADVTILLVKGGKVTANYSFRAGELNADQAQIIHRAAADLVKGE